MSLCDVCMSPGACCKRLTLTGLFSEPMSRERVEHELLKPEVFPQLKGVFQPGEQDERGVWRLWCTALLPNGRCSIYEDRPNLCRMYRPGQDPLCVHHWTVEEETK